MSAIDLIKNSIPIMDALDRYTAAHFSNVRTSRTRFNIRCPFHNDRNPSLTIYTDTNTFRCWSGCNDGRRGDVIDIVRLSQKVDTKEAIKLLVDDYGLKAPDSEQAKKWKKERARREQSVALKKELNKKVIGVMDNLREVERVVNDTLATIKTNEDLELVGDLYHLVAQINYWFECLANKSLLIQFEALEEVNRFLEKMSVKAGESA